MIDVASWVGGSLVSLLVALGLMLWLLVRRQKQRVWLPILRVIELDRKSLPQLRWVQPPWISFLMFLLAALGLILFAFKPYDLVLKNDNLDMKSTHVVFDLSPSVKYQVGIKEFRENASETLKSLSKDRKVTYSTTGDREIYTYTQSEEVNSHLDSFEFHRAGAKLGSVIEKVLQDLPQLEQLIIVSDRDQGTWEDFNWRYLTKRLEVSRIEVPLKVQPKNNVFIDEVIYKNDQVSQSVQTWSVSLRRINKGIPLSGSLEVFVGKEKLASKSWEFSDHDLSIEMDLTISVEKLKDTDSALTWMISGNFAQDLDMDNEFRTQQKQLGDEAVILAPSQGEMLLDDSVFHLKTSLEVAGLRVKRFDRGGHADQLGESPALIVSEWTPLAPYDRYCPLQSLSVNRNSMQQIWLLPSADLNDYGDICHCFSSIVKFPEKLASPPAFCRDLQSREQWIGVMQSIGAKQIGGSLSDAIGAIGMGFYNEASKTRLIGFTMPMQPNPNGGIGFGQLPLIIRSLLQLFPIQSPEGVRLAWPRLSEAFLTENGKDVMLSNVPYIESSLKDFSIDALPPSLSFVDKNLIRVQNSPHQEKDSMNWVYISFLLVMSSILLELIALLTRVFFTGKSWTSRWFFLMFLLTPFGYDSAWAQVKLNTLGFTSIGKVTPLKKDVSGRTSIELDDNSLSSIKFQKSLLSEPWIWAASPQNLDSLGVYDWNDLVTWLRRGGFLVIERAEQATALKQKISAHLPNGQWKPIPPDHELMRSFHLLSSLPQCGDHVWEGFHFDDRLAILLAPGEFLKFILDDQATCYGSFSKEQALRIFINIQMVVLATDYKKDQIHLPEILKRLR